MEPNHYHIIATEQDTNLRVDKFLANNVTDISRSRIKNLIESGNLLINGQIIKDSSATVKRDVTYNLTIPPLTESHISAKAMPLDIIYEDEMLLVINKQPGLTVHPGAGNHQDTLVNALLAYCPDSLSGIGGVQRPGIVHRLDKDTSGLMVVAKCDEAHNFLSQQLQDRSLSRVYLAIVCGAPKISSGNIINKIDRHPHNRLKFQVARTGRESITNYKTVEALAQGQASLLKCKLQTGRTHQIRVHLSHLGHPLIGDATYGYNKNKLAKLKSKIVDDFSRQALHATHIGFFHPGSKQYIDFSAQMPEDMQKLYDELKGDELVI